MQHSTARLLLDFAKKFGIKFPNGINGVGGCPESDPTQVEMSRDQWGFQRSITRRRYPQGPASAEMWLFSVPLTLVRHFYKIDADMEVSQCQQMVYTHEAQKRDGVGGVITNRLPTCR